MIKSASAYTIFCVEVSAHFYPPIKYSIWKKMISTQQQKTLSLSLETECHRPSKTWQWLLLSLCCLLMHFHLVLTFTGPNLSDSTPFPLYLWQKLVFLVNSRKEWPGSVSLWLRKGGWTGRSIKTYCNYMHCDFKTSHFLPGSSFYLLISSHI